jgi:3-methyladenine DNA glycosylase AlkD
MRRTVEELTRAIEADLQGASDPQRKTFTSGYFPTELDILGVSAPEIRTVVSRYSRELRPAPPEAVLRLAQELVDRRIHELRPVGYELLARRPDATDRLTRKDVERLGRGNDNWASVDAYALTIAGPAWRRGRISDRAVASWARSPNPWWRRTALVSTVSLNVKSRGGKGDVPRTLTVCDMLSEDREPSVIKALSWALRALIQHDRSVVEEFLARHRGRLPSLVLREVRSKLETGRKNPSRASPP